MYISKINPILVFCGIPPRFYGGVHVFQILGCLFYGFFIHRLPFAMSIITILAILRAGVGDTYLGM